MNYILAGVFITSIRKDTLFFDKSIGNNNFSRNPLKNKILIVYLQPAKMLCGG